MLVSQLIAGPVITPPPPSFAFHDASVQGGYKNSEGQRSIVPRGGRAFAGILATDVSVVSIIAVTSCLCILRDSRRAAISKHDIVMARDVMLRAEPSPRNMKTDSHEKFREFSSPVT